MTPAEQIAAVIVGWLLGTATVGIVIVVWARMRWR